MKLEYRYDKEADVLYASISSPGPATCEEPSDGILLRRDMKTNKVVGFTIINFSRQKRDGRLKTIPYFESVEIPY